MQVHHDRAVVRMEAASEGLEERGVGVPQLVREDVFPVVGVDEDDVIDVGALENELLCI